jgi:hypothetical protein
VRGRFRSSDRPRLQLHLGRRVPPDAFNSAYNKPRSIGGLRSLLHEDQRLGLRRLPTGEMMNQGSVLSEGLAMLASQVLPRVPALTVRSVRRRVESPLCRSP